MKRIKTAELVPGYVLAEDVYSFNGQLILTKGLVLTDKIITRLEFYSITSVRVEDEMTDVPDDTLPEVDLSSIKEELHSEVVRNSEEYAAFKQSFDESISGFKSSINNIVELNAPINTDSLLDSTKELISRGKNSSFSTMDMLHNMRQ